MRTGTHISEEQGKPLDQKEGFADRNQEVYRSTEEGKADKADVCNQHQGNLL